MRILVLFLLLFMASCSSNPVEVTHASGVGEVTFEVYGEPVTVKLDVETRDGLSCQLYELVYDGQCVLGYDRGSEECEFLREGTVDGKPVMFDYMGLIKLLLRISMKFL